MSSKPALEIRNLQVTYGGVHALRNVSITIPPGAVVALLGPNGAGKSTTLRTISGVMRAEGGTISFFGEPIHRAPAYRIARMGIVHVPEGRGIFPSLSVRENLDMASTFSDSVDAVDEATALFPVLGNRLVQTAGSLSGGEQQMLSLARALMSRPRLLMVDEISMGLAPIIVAQLFDALRTIASSGASLLLVEQYIETALDLADYVYVMEKGSVIDVGEPADMASGSLAAAYLGGAA
ncbi:MAG TPA: ABC transporter ATP-binding protein [Acidimicrobiales bacterium]|nr:ABC transporter ATP-binding protein [Acidimicrobiales bacterium]